MDRSASFAASSHNNTHANISVQTHAHTHMLLSQVDLLMDLLLKNHLEAESRVLHQHISPHQYFTGIDPAQVNVRAVCVGAWVCSCACTQR